MVRFGVNKDKIKTGFLCAMPSFLYGFAQAFDLFGDFVSYNESHTVNEADAEAIYSDWKMVGNDIRSAMSEVEKDIHVL